MQVTESSPNRMPVLFPKHCRANGVDCSSEAPVDRLTARPAEPLSTQIKDIRQAALRARSAGSVAFDTPPASTAQGSASGWVGDKMLQADLSDNGGSVSVSGMLDTAAFNAEETFDHDIGFVNGIITMPIGALDLQLQAFTATTGPRAISGHLGNSMVDLTETATSTGSTISGYVGDSSLTVFRSDRADHTSTFDGIVSARDRTVQVSVALHSDNGATPRYDALLPLLALT